MLVLRFFRVGKKNQPSFKIVVTEKTRPPRAGVFVEEVGFYNPLTKEKVFKADRIKYWLEKGVQPSDTAHNLLVQEKIIEGEKRKVKIKMPEAKEAQPEKTEAPAVKPESQAKAAAKPEETKPEEPKTESPAPAAEPAKAEEPKKPKEEKTEQPPAAET